LEPYLAHVVFLFLFFLFHDLDLELGMLVFSFWFRKFYRLGCFVPVIICHSLVLFLFHSCNKILLGFCFAHVVFSFLFFSFHDLNLELDMFMLSFWFRKSYRLSCFVPIIVCHKLVLFLFCFLQ